MSLTMFGSVYRLQKEELYMGICWFVQLICIKILLHRYSMPVFIATRSSSIRRSVCLGRIVNASSPVDHQYRAFMTNTASEEHVRDVRNTT